MVKPVPTGSQTKSENVFRITHNEGVFHTQIDGMNCWGLFCNRLTGRISACHFRIISKPNALLPYFTSVHFKFTNARWRTVIHDTRLPVFVNDGASLKPLLERFRLRNLGG